MQITFRQFKEKYVRLLILGNLTSWIIYDFFAKAYLAGISDLFVISSTITAIYRYDIKKEVKENEQDKRMQSILKYYDAHEINLKFYYKKV